MLINVFFYIVSDISSGDVIEDNNNDIAHGYLHHTRRSGASIFGMTLSALGIIKCSSSHDCLLNLMTP